MGSFKSYMGKAWYVRRNWYLNLVGVWGSCWSPVIWRSCHSNEPTTPWTRTDLIAVSKAQHAEVWIWDSKKLGTQKVVEVDTLKTARQVIIALDKMAEIEQKTQVTESHKVLEGK